MNLTMLRRMTPLKLSFLLLALLGAPKTYGMEDLSAATENLTPTPALTTEHVDAAQQVLIEFIKSELESSKQLDTLPHLVAQTASLLQRHGIAALSAAGINGDDLLADEQHCLNKKDTSVLLPIAIHINRNQRGTPIFEILFYSKNNIIKKLPSDQLPRDAAQFHEAIIGIQKLLDNKTDQEVLRNMEILTTMDSNGQIITSQDFLQAYPSLKHYNRQAAQQLPNETKTKLDNIFGDITPHDLIPKNTAHIRLSLMETENIFEFAIVFEPQYEALLQKGFTQLAGHIFEHKDLPGYVIKLCKYAHPDNLQSHYERIPFSDFLRKKIEELKLNITIPKKYAYFAGDQLIVLAEKKDLSHNGPFTAKQCKDILTLAQHGYLDPHDENVFNQADGSVAIIDTESHIGPTPACWHILYGSSELTNQLKALPNNPVYQYQKNTTKGTLIDLANLHPEITEHTCATCGIKFGEHNCGRCNAKKYCSRECQVADWSEHKKTCVKK